MLVDGICVMYICSAERVEKLKTFVIYIAQGGERYEYHERR